jgi:hypothetical protein
MLWMVLFIAWIITLWFLSSHSIPVTEEAPKILHFDKVEHFGYFFGGGYILATWSQLKYDDQSSLFTRYFFPIIFLSIYGAIDEYHQTFTPGRSGNDIYDWIADSSELPSAFFSPITSIGFFSNFHHLSPPNPKFNIQHHPIPY